MKLVWYIILMCFASIFNDRIFGWIGITLLFIWSYVQEIKDKKEKEENCDITDIRWWI